MMAVAVTVAVSTSVWSASGVGTSGREGYPIRIQNLAEGEGFEPPKACTLVVFKTTAIDRSAIPPATTMIRAVSHQDSLQEGHSDFSTGHAIRQETLREWIDGDSLRVSEPW